MNITGKKAQNLSKNREKFRKLQKVLEGTSQRKNLQNSSFVGIIKHATWHFARVNQYSRWEQYNRSNDPLNR
jgi:hypothetical protein